MSIDFEAIEAQLNRATPVEFVVLAGRYLPVLFMECKQQAEQLSSITAERDAAVEDIPHNCKTCKHDEDACPAIAVCGKDRDQWEWRGAGKEQNHD